MGLGGAGVNGGALLVFASLGVVLRNALATPASIAAVEGSGGRPSVGGWAGRTLFEDRRPSVGRGAGSGDPRPTCDGDPAPTFDGAPRRTSFGPRIGREFRSASKSG